MRSLAIVLLTALTLRASAQVDPRAVDKLMNATLEAWQIPGAAVAIVVNDRVVYAQGYGVTDLEKNEQVTADTLFQIASTSKAFTSTAVAMLAAEKKLQFDDPVRRHLDYFRLSDSCADAQVTVRDILSHRTGLSRHDELWDNTAWTRKDVIRMIGAVELSRPFRSAYQYQNIMYIAAGEVVAGVSGSTWDAFVRERLFKPLGMSRTVLTDAEWAASNHATGYRYDWRTGHVTLQKPIETTTIGAGGAIKSSARDMAQWIRFQLANGSIDGRQLVDPALLDETKMPQTPIQMTGSSRDNHPETNLMSYGMGWVIQDYRGELLVSHAGALNGFRTHVDLLPRRNAGFVVMGNLGRGMAMVAMRNSLADLLTGKPGRDWNAYYLMVDRAADEKTAREREERRAKRIAGTSPSRPLDAYAGTYNSNAYGEATVRVRDGKLLFEWARLSIPLEHFHYDVFTAEDGAADVDESVVFGLSPEHEITTMRIFGETFRKK